MANVSFWQTSWVDAGETGLLPGQEHYWVMWGYGYLDAVAVTAAPLNSDEGEQMLMVKDIQTETSAGVRRFFFTVRNTGPVSALGYGLNFSFITE